MPKKKGGHKKKRNKGKVSAPTRKITYKDDDQEYAQVEKLLGNRRVQCLCFDGITRICHIRGSMRKRCWVAVGDIVIISLRDFQDEKADIIHKYHTNEIRTLRNKGEIPDVHDDRADAYEDTFIFENEEPAQKEEPVNIESI